MATTKITITLPADQVGEIHSLVKAGRSASVSAFAKHAISVALSDAAGWKEMLEEALEKTGGPLTDKERLGRCHPHSGAGTGLSGSLSMQVLSSLWIGTIVGLSCYWRGLASGECALRFRLRRWRRPFVTLLLGKLVFNA